jgi:hypothetical protein
MPRPTHPYHLGPPQPLTSTHAHPVNHVVALPLTDDQLIGKVNGVTNQQIVSFGLIKLRADGVIDYDYAGKRIKKVWLKQKGSAI